MDINTFVGNKIKEFREKRGWTQDQLAEKLNTTRQTISRYESGTRKANQDTLFELSSIFNTSIDSFFPNKEEEDSNATLLAAHIDDDATEEEIQDILDYIEFKKKTRK